METEAFGSRFDEIHKKFLLEHTMGKGSSCDVHLQMKVLLRVLFIQHTLEMHLFSRFDLERTNNHLFLFTSNLLTHSLSTNQIMSLYVASYYNNRTRNEVRRRRQHWSLDTNSI